jgi:hypothetical protein
MGSRTPLGLLTIRRQSGELEAFAVYAHYQNGVDYLNTIAQAWTKLKENEFKTATGYIVKVELVIPRHIDLRKESYLWPEEPVPATKE